MKVLLFGTSGNPPTGRDGHSGIVDYFVNLEQFDELWVLPVYKHMFANKRDTMAEPGAPTFEDRVEMCRLSFEMCSTVSCKVKVLETEKEVFNEMVTARRNAGDTTMPPRTSSYDVIRYLQKRHPEAQFSFLVGTDTYQDLRSGKWRCSEELMKIVPFVVVDRLGVRRDNFLEGVELHHPPMLTNVSSTRIRNAGARELVLDSLTLEPSVLEYMRERRLYGFGRQSWLERTVDAASERVTKRWLIVAGAAGLLVAVGVGTAAFGNGWRKGGARCGKTRCTG